MSESTSAAVDRASVVREFVRLANEQRQGEIADLFADDATFMAPTGKTLHGRAAIHAFFTGLKIDFIAPKLPMRPTAIAVDGTQVLLAFESKQNGVYQHTAVDQFTVDDDGKISRFIVYIRPGEISEEFHSYHTAQAAAAAQA